MSRNSGLGNLAEKMGLSKKVEYNEDEELPEPSKVEKPKEAMSKEPVQKKESGQKKPKSSEGIVELDTKDIIPWKFDDRSDSEIERGLSKIISSIQANGQDTPILVRRKGQKFEEIYGRRRLEACRVLGIKVKAEVRELDDAAAMASQVIENNDREDVSAWSRAVSYKKAMDEKIYDSVTAFAVRCNLNRTTVSNLISTANRMPELLRKEIDLTYLGQNALLLVCGFCESHPDFVAELVANKKRLESDLCGPSTVKAIYDRWVSLIESKPAKNKRTINGKHGDYFTVTINNNGALLINFLKKGRELLTEDEISDLLRKAMDAK